MRWERSGTSGRVVRLDPAAHKVVDALLPWFVNGTLDADERALVERHLTECARCRRELDWLRDLHAACLAGEAATGGSSAFGKLRRRLEAPRQHGSPRTHWTRWVIGGQLALIAGLGAFTLQNQLQDADHAARYRTLAAPEAAPLQGALVVVFDPRTPEAELRRVLREADARVVDGPTAANAYVLDVPAAQATRALQTLRAERAVTLAEELAPRRGR